MIVLDPGWCCELALRRERWNACGTVCGVFRGPNRQVTRSVRCRRWDAARVLTAWFVLYIRCLSVPTNGLPTSNLVSSHARAARASGGRLALLGGTRPWTMPSRTRPSSALPNGISRVSLRSRLSPRKWRTGRFQVPPRRVAPREANTVAMPELTRMTTMTTRTSSGRRGLHRVDERDAHDTRAITRHWARRRPADGRMLCIWHLPSLRCLPSSACSPPYQWTPCCSRHSGSPGPSSRRWQQRRSIGLLHPPPGHRRVKRRRLLRKALRYCRHRCRSRRRHRHRAP